MTITYHFANPDIVNFFLLAAFIILFFAGIHLRKKEEYIKKSKFFIVSGLLASVWYIIFFFIPAFMFTAPPTAAEIQFTDNYMLVWQNLVPGLILILCLGVVNIIIGLNNKEEFGFYLVISGIIFISSILFGFIDFFVPSIIISTITTIIMAISILFFLYFSIKTKSIYLTIFCVIFLFSLAFPLIMPVHYIHIF
jgi:hypothetical protein